MCVRAATTFAPPWVTEPQSKNSGKLLIPSVPPPMFTTSLLIVIVVWMNVLVMVHSLISPIATVIVPWSSQAPLYDAV